MQKDRKVNVNVNVQELIAMVAVAPLDNAIETMSGALEFASNVPKYDDNGQLHILDTQVKTVVPVDSWQ